VEPKPVSRHPVQHNTYLLKVPGAGRHWGRALACLGVLTFALVLFLGQKNLFKLLSLYRERAEVAGRIAELKNSNQRLERQIQDLRANPKAVEPIAREELGLVLRNEYVYRFVPPQRQKTGN
jgi:cell division protein FtsB